MVNIYFFLIKQGRYKVPLLVLFYIAAELNLICHIAETCIVISVYTRENKANENPCNYDRTSKYQTGVNLIIFAQGLKLSVGIIEAA